jgi:hypothetical protein
MKRPSRVLGMALLVSLIVALPTSAFAASRPSTPSGQPSLSDQGQLLWNLEALLHQTFGSRQPSVSGKNVSENFSCAGDCSPLSTYSPYFYTFTNLGKSDMRLSSADVLKDSFGNYPVPVLIRGKAIACNSAGTEFLAINRAESSFTLMCLAPQHF